MIVYPRLLFVVYLAWIPQTILLAVRRQDFQNLNQEKLFHSILSGAP
jgi:hypothetical protein